MVSTAARPRSSSPDLELRAYQQAQDYTFVETGTPGLFTAKKKDGARYSTTVNSCTCRDCIERKRLCKHSRMLRMHLQAEADAAAKPQPKPAPNPTAAETEAERRARIKRQMARDFPDF